jgi:hypothetical protein
MWKKKCVASWLLAGIIISTTSCNSAPGPRLQLLHSVQLRSYPSASAMALQDGKLFLFGDDAPFGITLDTSFHILDTISIGWSGKLPASGRIEKDRKPDIESCVIIPDSGKNVLYAFGSGATPLRNISFAIAPGTHVRTRMLPLSFNGKRINIEGVALAGRDLYFANRANRMQPKNQLLRVPLDGYDANRTEVIGLELPGKAGISDLYYIFETDLMLFTASIEDTPDAVHDGKIGDSYLGWIRSFSRQKGVSIKATGWINLSQLHPDFKKEKIEAVCAMRLDRDNYMLYMAADNDNGTSTMFQAILRF